MGITLIEYARNEFRGFKDLNKNIKQNIRPIMLLTAMLLGLPTQSIASGSGYYEIPEGRPPSAFDSKCCCRKEGDTEEQELYICHIAEGESCPDQERYYNVTIINCPGSLFVKKIAKVN